MALPPRSYYHIDEVAEAWGSSIPELASFVMDDLLQISVMALCVDVEIGTYEECMDSSWTSIPWDMKSVSGLQPVKPHDLWPVFQEGAAEIRSFRPTGHMDYVMFRREQLSMRITLKDLLISATDRKKFEQAYGLGEFAEEAPANDPVFTHNETYTSVCLDGEKFVFGQCQAAVVRHLHQASQTDQEWVDGKTLLRKAGSESLRIVDLFKGKEWRKLIAGDKSGRYRLRLPSHPTPEATDRAYRRFRWKFGGLESLQRA